MEGNMIKILKDHMILSMGVKPAVADKIEISKFVHTLFEVANMDRNDSTINGEPLTNYKLDSRLGALVLPRGVYVSNDVMAINLMDASAYNAGDMDLATPTEFQEIQAEMLGSMRKKVEFNTNLFDASAAVTLSEVIERVSYKGNCNLSGKLFMPIALDIEVYKSFWYNFDVNEMMKLLIIEVFANLR